MKKKTKQEIDKALKSTGLIERVIAHICCGIIFGLIGMFLLIKFNSFWSYVGVVACAIAVLTAVFNIITSITMINKIQSGNFRHITEHLIGFSACSGIIPGRADYMQANTSSFQFYIHKINDVGFKIGDMIDAVFLGTENVPIHVAKIEKEKEENIEMNKQPENLIKENQNKGFSLVPVIAPFLIILIITIIAIIYPFVK